MATALRSSTRAPSRTATSTRPRERSKITVSGNHGVKVVRAVTIRRPASELYAFWRDVEQIPRVVEHRLTVTRISETEAHWEVSAPGNQTVAWDSLIIADQPDRLIAWRSREGALVPNAGTIRFEPAPGDEGTEVTVSLEYNPPGGKVAALLAKLTGKEGEQQVSGALRRFKALMEAGEIPTIEGQPVGSPQGKGTKTKGGKR
jgi:uncharacterized membrane protein